MLAGEKVKVKQNFSGRLIESYILPTDKGINESNEALISEFWRDEISGSLKDTGKGWIAENVKVDVIESFLNHFQTHPDFAEQKYAVVAYLQKIAEEYPKGDILLISVKKNSEDAAGYRLGSQERASAKRIGDAWRVSKNRVASRGDEKLGLDEHQESDAERIALEANAEKPSDFHYRSVRKKPLLMIHVLGPVGSEDGTNRVPAFGVSFPPGDYETEIEVVANTVWIDRMLGAPVDSPEEEEDNDE
jgi:hypothetical protein